MVDVAREYPRVHGDNGYVWVRFGAALEYPRVHGDNYNGNLMPVENEGIPPRARGLQDAKGDAVGCTRNTPAYTGTTTIYETIATDVEEYPRVHGDYG